MLTSRSLEWIQRFNQLKDDLSASQIEVENKILEIEEAAREIDALKEVHRFLLRAHHVLMLGSSLRVICSV